MEQTLKRVFLGPDAKVRPIWRAGLYYVLGTFVIFPLLNRPFTTLAEVFHLSPGLTPGNITLAGLRNLIVALICTGAFAVYERHRIDSYGLPVDRAFGRQTFEGAAVAVIMAGTVAIGMILLGGVQIKGFANTGHALTLYALAWLIATVCAGFAEEFWFRSYLLQTLWKGVGFWPAAIVIGLIFAAEHYFFKEGENVWDVITLISLSLLMSYSVLRIGTLWFAVGFHFAFNYMQLFIIGTPNGSRFPVGRLLDARFNGPAWLTGGVLGTEASLLMYPAIALLWLYVWWRYRANPPLQPAKT